MKGEDPEDYLKKYFENNYDMLEAFQYETLKANQLKQLRDPTLKKPDATELITTLMLTEYIVTIQNELKKRGFLDMELDNMLVKSLHNMMMYSHLRTTHAQQTLRSKHGINAKKSDQLRPEDLALLERELWAMFSRSLAATTCILDHVIDKLGRGSQCKSIFKSMRDFDGVDWIDQFRRARERGDIDSEFLQSIEEHYAELGYKRDKEHARQLDEDFASGKEKVFYGKITILEKGQGSKFNIPVSAHAAAIRNGDVGARDHEGIPDKAIAEDGKETDD